MITIEEIMQKVDRYDQVAINALMRLYDRDQLRNKFLFSLADQVLCRKHLVERGERDPIVPLLSAEQIRCLKAALHSYKEPLLAIAREREVAKKQPATPRCDRCQQPCDCRFRDTDYCAICVRQVEREVMQESSMPVIESARCEGCCTYFPVMVPGQTFCDICQGEVDEIAQEETKPTTVPDYGRVAVNGADLRFTTQREVAKQNILATGNKWGFRWSGRQPREPGDPFAGIGG